MEHHHHKRHHTGSECVGTNTYESMYEKHMPERSRVYIEIYISNVGIDLYRRSMNAVSIHGSHT